MGARIASRAGVMNLPVLALSGEELLLALLRAGYRLRSRTDGTMVLERGYRRVAIPEQQQLLPQDVMAMLREAGITYLEFLELLEAATRHGTPTGTLDMLDMEEGAASA